MNKHNKIEDVFFSFLKEFIMANNLKKERLHLPKYEFFLKEIINNQLDQENYTLISNRFLRKVIRQPIITRMKYNLIRLGVIECNYEMLYCKPLNGKPKGEIPYGYRITPEYFNFFKELINTSRLYENTNGTALLNDTNESGFKSDNNGVAFNVSINGSVLPDNYNKAVLLPHLERVYNESGLPLDVLEKRRVEFQEKTKRKNLTRWDILLSDENLPEYRFIRDNTHKLSIDKNGYRWIEEQVKAKLRLKNKKREFVNNDGRVVSYIAKNRFLDEENGKQWKGDLVRIDKGLYRFSCPESTHRVYYNITSMPSELRQFLRFKGEELYCLDYSNFQPFLFIKALKERFSDEIPSDVSRYIELTSKGQFYAEIMRLIIVDGIEIKNQDSFKIDFFARVFFSNEKRKYKFRLVFDKHFPNVSALITESKKENYKDLSIGLQKFEAEIVINNILREIAIKYPEAFVLPIHDAILCESGMSDVVKNLMYDKAEEIIGHRPTIK
jgi:hypothetical protein